MQCGRLRNCIAILIAWVIAQLNAVTAVKSFLTSSSSRQLQPTRVACIGDSITQGLPGPPEQSYPARLQELLGPSFLVHNFGRGWSSLLPPISGYPPEVIAFEGTPQYNGAVQFQPNVVVVMLGTNDAMTTMWTAQRAQAFAWRYSALITNLRRQSPPPRILLAIPPPAYSKVGKTYGGNNQTVINTMLPQVLRQIAESNGLGPPIDTFSLFAAQCPSFLQELPCAWMADAELHPNAVGYYQIAIAVMHQIAAAPR
mmetsp:Transcript_54136/g.86080  ORF Transcript_54136/g.86080 Transcript_54136/m.86080 type:complete len:256 (+) Transcript_54136:58-825(+)